VNLLHLDSSILGDASVSRRLTRALVDQLRAENPGVAVTYRDLAADALPHLSAAALAQPNDALIDELKAADVLVIGAPMYNFAIPTVLKAWIDRVAVAGKTFKYTDAGPQGLVGARKAYVIATSGGEYGGTPVATMHAGYLKQTLRFIGVADVEVITAEGLALPQRRDAALARAQAQIASLQLEAA